MRGWEVENRLPCGRNKGGRQCRPELDSLIESSVLFKSRKFLSGKEGLIYQRDEIAGMSEGDAKVLECALNCMEFYTGQTLAVGT